MSLKGLHHSNESRPVGAGTWSEGKMARNTHPEDVKAMVRKTGVTLAELARRHGLSTSAVRKSIHRATPSGNRVIAAYLGRPLCSLWPEWFDADGNRLPSKTVRKHSRPATAGNCQKRKAA